LLHETLPPLDGSPPREDTVEAMDACIVCRGGLPEMSVRTRDPFCSTSCAREHYGTGTRDEHERARRQQLQRHIEEGTDPASLELRRVTVEERQKLIAEGRFIDAFLQAYREHLIAHKQPVSTPTVTWFSPRESGPTMRSWDDDDEAWRERRTTRSEVS
jgi:hypothetical protein